MYVLYFLTAGFLVFLMIGIICRYFVRRLVPDRYEWLQVLSHTDWKDTTQIKSDMAVLKKISRNRVFIFDIFIYSDLVGLEDEKMIECSVLPMQMEVAKYRLLPSGSKRKIKNTESEAGLLSNAIPST